MLRITNVEGYKWPLNVSCENCGISFAIESPTDLDVILEREFVETKKELNDNGYFKTVHIFKLKITYYVQCPICNAEYEIQEEDIPPTIRSQIPYLTEYYLS